MHLEVATSIKCSYLCIACILLCKVCMQRLLTESASQYSRSSVDDGHGLPAACITCPYTLGITY